MLLLTATLFAASGAFPTYENFAESQQTGEFCATLEYLQEDPAAYVHLCYTPGKGNTFFVLCSVSCTLRCFSSGCLSSKKKAMSVTQCLIIAQSFLYAHCAICNQGVCCASFTTRICIQSVVFHTCFLLPHLFHCHCRYLHRGTPPKMSTLHHAERNYKECDTSRRGARGSIFCYIM